MLCSLPEDISLNADNVPSQVLPPETQQELLKVCLSAVRARRSRPGYGFLSEGALVEALFSCACRTFRADELSAGHDLEAKVARMALTVYSDALYRGCQSHAGAEQNRAFTELASYLYRIAYHLVSAAGAPVLWAQDYTQDALQTIWLRLDGCREPGAFLKWSTIVLIRIVRHGLRRERRDLPMPEED